MMKEYPRIFLQTGDCFLAVQPTLVTTVLGSCVAITMTSRERGVGAICHAFLPDSKESKKDQRDPQPCRFVNTAIENMLQGMTKLGVSIPDLQVKLFGGASGIAAQRVEGSTYNVGRRNVEAARRILGNWGLSISTEDVAGSQGRKLHFLSNTGEIWMKRLTGQAMRGLVSNSNGSEISKARKLA
ncbi:chemotaxis protein CheD [Pseudodesulfovibrio senegalensis]|jgi:chemotaxis protein CheD|uniref:Probable chemoreceptor glutamine deamidase CheD n=2 Tax=Pseudodesulfovibrio senegalensis TaxID=1721087 RepID=A0A6N6MZ83_9BACT|nr:chemotaxis protein CheD [Pseudodesulfovibrio senegalensis]